jgi:hypothetical protein
MVEKHLRSLTGFVLGKSFRSYTMFPLSNTEGEQWET